MRMVVSLGTTDAHAFGLRLNKLSPREDSDYLNRAVLQSPRLRGYFGSESVILLAALRPESRTTDLRPLTSDA